MRKPRFVVLCVPGEAEDGSDSWWFVHDRTRNRSVEIGSGDECRTKAARRARELNEKRGRR